MSYYAEETYDVYLVTTRKARVEHQCQACRATIKPGHYYAKVSIVFDGRGESVKRCGRCETTHRHLRALGSRDGRWPDKRLNCGLDYEREWDEEPPEYIAQLPFISGDEASALLSPPYGPVKQW